MIKNLLLIAGSLFFVIKGATLSTRYAVRLAESFQLSKYVVGFIIVAVISILPETFISLNAAIRGNPAFGLGTLFGGNVADLTLVFAIIVLIAGRGIKVQSEILKNNIIFPFLLLIPILLGLDGHYSRTEGALLIITGIIFYYLAFKNGFDPTVVRNPNDKRWKNIALLIGSMIILLVSSYYTVVAATDLAGLLGIRPFLVGLFIVSLGTVMPELIFSLRSVRKRHDSLAVGDILGTVLADATVVIGILALLSPFAFPVKLIYSTGAFMVVAAFILFYFMRTGRSLSRKEGLILFLFWIIFILFELWLNFAPAA